MKLKHFRSSLPTKLSAWFVISSAVLFVGALGYMFFVARDFVRRESEMRAKQILDNTMLRVNGILEDVEIAADNVEWMVLRNLSKPDSMILYSNAALANNRGVNSCSISFEPYYYPEKGLYYSIFSYRNQDGEIEWEQEGDENYQYFYMDWYLMPKLLGRSCWTEPYNDKNEEDDEAMDTEMMISYCRPIFDADSVFVGSISLDISLKWLSETLSPVKPYPNSYCIMVGRGGTYLVHPDSEKLFYQTLFTGDLESPDPDRHQLGQALHNREEGMQRIYLDGQLNYVFYNTMAATGWGVAIVFPERDIFGAFHRLQRTVLLLVLLGLTLLMALSYLLIHRQLAPLHELATEAENIASGHLDHPLKTDDRTDEIGVLNRSFRDMQSSLVTYIDELKETTASKERIERELQIARNIQMAMIPHVFPEQKDMDLYALMIPAREVGGDLYDFLIQDDKLYFCLGDVSGKGVPASLVMSLARGMFRILARQSLSPAEIARQINEMSSEDNPQMIFVTMFIAALDLKSGVLEYCNCGHNNPVLIPDSAGQAEFLACEPNVALGVMSGFCFKGQTIEDFRGKTLFVYTDGLNEAENADHEQFGNERMLKILRETAFVDARSEVMRLKQSVDVHVNGAEQSDDLTMLCIRFAP